MMPFIKIEHLCFSYEGEDGESKTVLHDLNLQIEKGSFVAILGHNGSGKSTLAKLLNLLLTPDGGKIYVDGTDITREDLTEDELYDIRRKIGIVFQNPDNQLVATVVEEDIAFGPENLGVSPHEIRKRVDAAMALLGISELAKMSPSHLSGGQKQRVAVAGIVAMLPECIIFDEATAMLDPSGRAEVMNTIRMLHEEKKITVLHITHNMEEAVQADRVIVLDGGRIVADGTPLAVFSQAKLLRDAGLELPQPCALLQALKDNGVSFPMKALDTASVATLLLRQYQEIKGN